MTGGGKKIGEPRGTEKKIKRDTVANRRIHNTNIFSECVGSQQRWKIVIVYHTNDDTDKQTQNILPALRLTIIYARFSVLDTFMYES